MSGAGEVQGGAVEGVGEAARAASPALSYDEHGSVCTAAESEVSHLAKKGLGPKSVAGVMAKVGKSELSRKSKLAIGAGKLLAKRGSDWNHNSLTVGCRRCCLCAAAFRRCAAAADAAVVLPIWLP